MLNERLLLQLAFGLPVAPLHPLPIDPSRFVDFGPRDYQEDILWEVVERIEQGYTRILVQLPTGGGKTVIASALLGALLAGKFGDFDVHRKELIEQTSKTFLRQGIAHSFVAPKKPFDPAAQVLLNSVQTLVRRLGMVRVANLVIIDEAHHAVAGTWQTIINSLPPGTIVIGLSATPERLDGRGLGDQFQVMVRGPSVAWLIENGYLAPFEYYGPSEPDLTGIRSLGGDWAKNGLAEACDKPKLVGDIVEHYLRLAAGKQGIGFAVSREHSRKIVDAFIGEGVRAAHVDSESEDRERLDAAFRAGDLQILSNCELFGEGYDVPSAVYAGLWRPTKSLAMFMQQAGRVLRFEPGKTAIIGDHAGNWRRHGFPDDEREWSLEGRAPSNRATGCNSDAPPIHQCLTCYRITFSTVTTCPGCGTEFPRQDRSLKHEAGRLSKLEREEERKKLAADKKAERELQKMEREAERVRVAAANKAEVEACYTFNELHSLAIKRGYKGARAWAERQAMYRRMPREEITAEMFD